MSKNARMHVNETQAAEKCVIAYMCKYVLFTPIGIVPSSAFANGTAVFECTLDNLNQLLQLEKRSTL